MESEIQAVLQAGFAGILLVYIWVVNRQFMALAVALSEHLRELTAMLEKCIGNK